MIILGFICRENGWWLSWGKVERKVFPSCVFTTNIMTVAWFHKLIKLLSGSLKDLSQYTESYDVLQHTKLLIVFKSYVIGYIISCSGCGTRLTATYPAHFKYWLQAYMQAFLFQNSQAESLYYGISDYDIFLTFLRRSFLCTLCPDLQE